MATHFNLRAKAAVLQVFLLQHLNQIDGSTCLELGECYQLPCNGHSYFQGFIHEKTVQTFRAGNQRQVLCNITIPSMFP